MRSINFIVLACIALSASFTSASSIESTHKVVSCSAKDASSCGKGQYCLAATKGGEGHCATKLKGGQGCRNDQACRSSICFISKKTAPHAGKRVCADESASGFGVGDRCTQSKQCLTAYCSKGYCKNPVASSAKCTKNAACSDDAKCLTKAETFIVYDFEGNPQTRKLTAGECSYVANLGEGMACSSDDQCYATKFECSTQTKKCVAKPLLGLGDTCQANDDCQSGACVSGRCGCSVDSECPSGDFCSASHNCQAKFGFNTSCDTANQCISGSCQSGVCGCAFSGDCSNIDPDTYCNKDTATCEEKGSYGDHCSDGQACFSNACTANACECGRRANARAAFDWLFNIERRC